MKISRRHRPAFTLIEMLIVAAIFSIIFLVATSLFVSIQSSQRQVLARQRVVADGRYVMETIARQVRLGQIDYSYYRQSDVYGVNNAQVSMNTTLPLIDQEGKKSCFIFDSANVKIGSYTNLNEACDPNAANNITPSDLEIIDLHFIVTPRSDPFAGVPIGNKDCWYDPLIPTTTAFNSIEGTCSCNPEDSDPITKANDKCLYDQQCVQIGTSTTVGICQNANAQPTVTIVLHTMSKNMNAGERAEVTMQTTVTSRVYRR